VTEESIFAAALEKLDPADRAKFLADTCGTDSALRRRVELLLAAHTAAGDFLDRPPFSTDANATRTAGGTAAAGDEGLDFLDPPTRPGSVGRIGHYEVLEVLGRGGFGIVFRAFDDTLQRVVAVKVLAPSIAATSPARKRFEREATSFAQVKHENVVHVYSVEKEPLPYLVMEFVPGETLQQKLDRTGPLDIPEVLRLGRQIAEGLAAAHATGLIHRDVKPANVLIEGGPHGRAKLTDFGLARAADDASISQSGVVAGTPLYMAPEQAKGDTLDHRADLFSLGSVLYTMLTGRPAFRASTTLAVLKRVADDEPRPIREVIPEVPEWMCRIVMKLLAKDPADRFQTAREVADVLADCEAQLKQFGALRDFSRIPGGKPTRGPVGKMVLASSLVVLSVVGAVAVALGLFWKSQAPPDGQLTIHTDDPGLVIMLDGQLVSWSMVEVPDGLRHEHSRSVGMGVKPGEHRVLALKDGRPFQEANFVIAPGEQKTVEFRAAPPPPGGGASDKDRLQGTWVAMTGETLGGPLQPEELKRLTIEFDGDRVSISKVNRQREEGTFKLDTAREPRAIDLTRGDKRTMRGIYRLEENRLTLCMDDWDEPRPERFETDHKTSRMVVTLRRASAEEAGWVSLFNGKDLTGWAPLAEQPGTWQVTDGVLVGSGGPGHLYSVRGDYQNFRLRAEVAIGKGADADVYVRATEQSPGPPGTGRSQAGYAVALAEGKDVYTGAISFRNPQSGTHITFGTAFTVKPDEWFTLEVIADGNRLVTRVNGVTTVERDELLGAFSKGHIALQVWKPDTVIKVRRIEVKELPPALPAPVVVPTPTAEVPVKPAPRAAADPAVPALREAVAAVTTLRDNAKARFDAGSIDSGALAVAEAALAEARIKLAEAERDIPRVAALLAELVAHRQETRRVVAERVKAEVDAPAALAEADAALADAKARLARAKPNPDPPPAVAPFGAAKAKELQEAWAKHLGVPVEVTNPVGMRLRLIPPGEFTMGSSREEVDWLLSKAPDLKDAEWWLKDWVRAEGPGRRVTVREPFLVGVHEVTVGQFREFVKDTGYKTEAERTGGGFVWDDDRKAWDQDPGHVWDSPKYAGGESHPVVFVTPADARAFCAWLGRKDGRTYSLPAEEQWEYACRAGTTTRWWFGDDPAEARKFAWTVEHSGGRHRPGGQLAANPFGLFDVHGNAAELVTTPQGAVYERGGEADESAFRARSAWRHPVDKVAETHARRGFRVVVVLGGK
jgi:uncharacterized protein (TIGR03067 family)